ncbi:unnamed protein product [Urochloa humidicola]
MEETVEATATVIRFLGDAIVEDNCEKLLEKARGAEEAADAAGVGHADLTRTAAELEAAAGEEGRLLAVVKLRDASAALEAAARAPLHALRGASANLTRFCKDYRDTAIGMLGVLRAKEAAGAGRARGSWWRSIWRWCRPQQGLSENLLADVEACLQPKMPVDPVELAATVDLLSEGMPQLQKRGVKLLAQARGVVAAAHGARVPCDRLAMAIDALERADNPTALLNCIDNLDTEATAMEVEENALLEALRDRAADLARACRELKEGADAMRRVQRAAAKLRERRATGTLGSCFFGWSRRRIEQREEELQDDAPAEVAVEPRLGQGDDKRSAMALFALGASLTMITNLEKVADSVNKLSQCFRWRFNIVICLWWTLLAVGVPRSAYARTLRELRCLQILCRIGMLGVNLFVIFFLNLSLDYDDEALLWVLLISALLLHSFFFVRAVWRGDLTK